MELSIVPSSSLSEWFVVVYSLGYPAKNTYFVEIDSSSAVKYFRDRDNRFDETNFFTREEEEKTKVDVVIGGSSSSFVVRLQPIKKALCIDLYRYEKWNGGRKYSRRIGCATLIPSPTRSTRLKREKQTYVTKEYGIDVVVVDSAADEAPFVTLTISSPSIDFVSDAKFRKTCDDDSKTCEEYYDSRFKRLFSLNDVSVVDEDVADRLYGWIRVRNRVARCAPGTAMHLQLEMRDVWIEEAWFEHYWNVVVHERRHRDARNFLPHLVVEACSVWVSSKDYVQDAYVDERTKTIHPTNYLDLPFHADAVNCKDATRAMLYVFKALYTQRFEKGSAAEGMQASLKGKYVPCHVVATAAKTTHAFVMMFPHDGFVERATTGGFVGGTTEDVLISEGTFPRSCLLAPRSPNEEVWGACERACSETNGAVFGTHVQNRLTNGMYRDFTTIHTASCFVKSTGKRFWSFWFVSRSNEVGISRLSDIVDGKYALKTRRLAKGTETGEVYAILKRHRNDVDDEDAGKNDDELLRCGERLYSFETPICVEMKKKTTTTESSTMSPDPFGSIDDAVFTFRVRKSATKEDVEKGLEILRENDKYELRTYERIGDGVLFGAGFLKSN